jgi:hypothetical protein
LNLSICHQHTCHDELSASQSFVIEGDQDGEGKDWDHPPSLITYAKENDVIKE